MAWLNILLLFTKVWVGFFVLCVLWFFLRAAKIIFLQSWKMNVENTFFNLSNSLLPKSVLCLVLWFFWKPDFHNGLWVKHRALQKRVFQGPLSHSYSSSILLVWNGLIARGVCSETFSPYGWKDRWQHRSGAGCGRGFSCRLPGLTLGWRRAPTQPGNLRYSSFCKASSVWLCAENWLHQWVYITCFALGGEKKYIYYVFFTIKSS